MIERALLAVLILLLPLQFGRHFWPSWSYIFGLKIDYLSPTLYLQDIFVFLLFFCFLGKKNKRKLDFKIWALGAVFLLFILANVYFSVQRIVSLQHWLRIAEMVLLCLAVSRNKDFVWKWLLKTIPFWLAGEFVLGLLQFWRQSSVGGIFRLLGERSFNVFTPGIAKASWLGKIFLRPYGTFSHPNSLAGFVLICLLLLLSKKNLSFFDRVSLLAGSLLLILCFSRTVWLAILIICLFFLLRQLYKGFRTKLPLSFIYLFTLSALLATTFLFQKTTIEQSSFAYRQELTAFSLKTIRGSPLFGIGANAFIVKLSQDKNAWQWIAFLQPVHNVFLLTGSEVGLTGLILFTIFLIFTIRRVLQLQITNYKLQIMVVLMAIVFTGMFDHYWLTLIQNQLLFAVVLGMAWGNSDKIKV